MRVWTVELVGSAPVANDIEVLGSSSYSNWTDVERVDGKEVKLVGAGAAA